MIPHLPLKETVNETVDCFIQSLKRTPFSGEIRADFSSRLLSSTDNSIYQILPQAVLFPRVAADIIEIFQLADQVKFKHITFSPRGGGTGTNGQSLSSGIVIDCSKYMNQILEVNLEDRWVKVQPGVVLDQLNQHLERFGYFFAPHLAPGNRATLGGMISTDACGKGSRIYGRTSDHILELTWVLSEGTTHTSKPVSTSELPTLKQLPGLLGKIYRQVDEIVTTKKDLIEKQFPKMPRFLTGYNLAKVYGSEGSSESSSNGSSEGCSEEQGFDLNRILAGSEGTLAVVTEAKLKLTSIPKYKALFAIHYESFDHALASSQALLDFQPAAIETLDETILALAKQDVVYDAVENFITEAKAINLVEFVSDRAQQLEDRLQQLEDQLTSKPDLFAIGYHQTSSPAEMEHLWTLRKRGVGLLGNRKGARKPIAFIEDTAVPPVHLVSYVRELKAVLERYELDYAMFGHVDVGCLHVRPALNLQVPQDESLIREITDQVVVLVRRYGGVLWAEHGKGLRAEYTPLFFGAELYTALRTIKTAFDPNNRLNPGKIVVPLDNETSVARLESPLRGHFDRQVSAEMQADYASAFSCNGNGACFNVNPNQVMCPSYKEGLDRIHSPKGRATLLREWLRQLTLNSTASDSASLNPASPSPATKYHLSEFETPADVLTRTLNTVAKIVGQYDYSHEVHSGLRGCLSCKACASQCPIHVNIPSLKAQFLQQYHTRYLRSPRDYLMAHIEELAQWQARLAGLSNRVLQNSLAQFLLRFGLGLAHPPQASAVTIEAALRERKASMLKPDILAQADRNNSVILLLDRFTSTYEVPLVCAVYDLLKHLGLEVYVSPAINSGKPLHVLGFLKKFEKVAQHNINFFESLQKFELPVVGIEPSVVLTYRDEYEALNSKREVQVQLIQEFLISQLHRLEKVVSAEGPYQLLGHCSERYTASTSQKQWQQIFEKIGLHLEMPEIGCCGMAGLYGYEIEHLESSKRIYQSSWEMLLKDKTVESRKRVLATGLSCRSQVQRMGNWTPQHPAQVLERLFRKTL